MQDKYDISQLIAERMAEREAELDRLEQERLDKWLDTAQRIVSVLTIIGCVTWLLGIWSV